MNSRDVQNLPQPEHKDLYTCFTQYCVDSHVTVFLINGVKLTGILTCAFPECLTISRDGINQLVMAHAIATVMPQDAFHIYDIMGGE